MTKRVSHDERELQNTVKKRRIDKRWRFELKHKNTVKEEEKFR